MTDIEKILTRLFDKHMSESEKLYGTDGNDYRKGYEAGYLDAIRRIRSDLYDRGVVPLRERLRVAEIELDSRKIATGVNCDLLARAELAERLLALAAVVCDLAEKHKCRDWVGPIGTALAAYRAATGGKREGT